MEKPKYGGVITIALGEAMRGFDMDVTGRADLMHNTNDEPLVGDWTRSGAGTGDVDFRRSTTTPFNVTIMVPNLLESYELPDKETIIANVRPGIHWENKFPTNGRELTAEDIAFSIDRLWFLPTSYGCTFFGPENKPQTIEVVDKHTVKFTIIPPNQDQMFANSFDWNPIFAKDNIEHWGDQTDWRNTISTGPYILTDVVPGSSYTMERMPNYWRKAPLYPEDTMPYPDGVKFLVIPDLSTRMAALRTGKIDWLTNVVYDDAVSLWSTNPELKWAKDMQPVPAGIHMRADNPDLPWFDKTVRHALQMAVNREEIRDDLYNGEAVIYQWPIMPITAWGKAVVPFEDLPAATQDLFKYNPTGAKALLAEAGYPSGFKAKVVTRQKDVDLLLVIKEYWADIGVDLDIDVKETGVYWSIVFARSHEEMVAFDAAGTHITTFDQWGPSAYQNLTMIVEPETVEGYKTAYANWLNWPAIEELWQGLTPFVLDYAATVAPPAPYMYTFWQPWVKDYNGEFSVGSWNRYDFAEYIWIDQELKDSLQQ